MVTYKLDKFLGRSAFFAGIVLFIIGLIVIYFSYVSIILCLFAAFIAFSYSKVQISTEKKLYRFNRVLFGFITIGKWLSIEDYDQLRVGHLKREYTAYSLSNKRLDTLEVDYRIFLAKSQDPNERLLLCKCKTLHEAIAEVENLAQLLELPVPDDLK